MASSGDSSGTIRVLSGPLAGAEFHLDDRILIGRLSECDVHLVDGQVSREHAMLVRQANDVLLVDLQSSNGTFMAGQPVKRQQLKGGDHFRISESTFVYDDGGPAPGPPAVGLSDAEVAFEQRGTREVSRVGPGSAPSPGNAQRPTVELPTEEPGRPTAEFAAQAAPDAGGREGPTGEPEARPTPASSKATVELEAAAKTSGTAELYPVPSSERPPLFGEADSEAGEDADEAAESVGDMPVFLPPPPVKGGGGRPGSSGELEYTEVEASFSAHQRTAVTRAEQSDYEGNLLDDITTYRSFRMRLQRDEIPTGEEVSAMIDLEARLRNPAAGSDTRRDVVSQRFFRRFMFTGPMTVRIQLSRRTVHLEGHAEDLSVDGLRATLNLSEYRPERDKFAVLILEGPRADRVVQFMFTSRVVWVEGGEVGFVFAGAPSWKERSSQVEEAKTDARPAPGGS